VHRYLITGTDTGVGKTRVTAVLAGALANAGHKPTIVKLVQTGITAGEIGDAAHAGALAGIPFMELARFSKPADPWSAALADGMPPVRAIDLQHMLERVPGAVVAEGAGGLAVPLNRTEDFGTVARLAQLKVILAVGLRLGCMNHALLTLAMCEHLRIPLAGAVLVEFLQACEPSYVDDVTRVLQGKVRMFGMLPFEPNEPSSLRHGTQLFRSLM
jgi:dethiobiotin synthetase